MQTALMLLVLATADAPAETELSLGAGAVGTAYVFGTGRTGAGSLIQTVGGRTRAGKVGFEGTLSGLEPLGRTGNASLLLESRTGYAGERLELLGGVVAQLAFNTPAPAQLLPTVRAAYRFDTFTLSGGLFDLQGYAPARVSVDVANFGVGYVAPIGGEAHASFRVSERLSLRGQLLYVRVYSAEVAMATVSGAFDVGGSR